MRENSVNSVFTNCYSNKVIQSIFEVHFPYADKVLDMTYGKGVFWKKWNHPEVIGIDILSTKAGATLVADSRHLPFADNSFDVTVIDPPFVDFSQHSTVTSFNDCYQVQRGGSGQVAITFLYDDMIKEAARVSSACIIKCKDTISSRNYIPRLFLTYKSVYDAGFTPVDTALLVPTAQAPDNWINVEHFRRKESYFLVCIRQDKYKKWINNKSNPQKI